MADAARRWASAAPAESPGGTKERSMSADALALVLALLIILLLVARMR